MTFIAHQWCKVGVSERVVSARCCPGMRHSKSHGIHWSGSISVGMMGENGVIILNF